MLFHPKRDRSKSIPIINVNLRLKALKELKEDIQMKKNKVPHEIESTEEELIVPVLEYNYNYINREIMEHPIEKEIIPMKPKQRVSQQDVDDDNEFMIPNESLPESNQDKYVSLIPKKDYLPYKKIIRCYKYKTSYYLDIEDLNNHSFNIEHYNNSLLKSNSPNLYQFNSESDINIMNISK